MPRQSPYQIVLSREEFRELSAQAQMSLPYFQVLRAKMICWLRRLAMMPLLDDSTVAERSSASGESA